MPQKCSDYRPFSHLGRWEERVSHAHCSLLLHHTLQRKIKGNVGFWLSQGLNKRQAFASTDEIRFYKVKAEGKNQTELDSDECPLGEVLEMFFSLTMRSKNPKEGGNPQLNFGIWTEESWALLMDWLKDITILNLYCRKTLKIYLCSEIRFLNC